MHSALIAAHAPEFDVGRVVFVIMLLLGGFFQWVMNWWKQKKAEAERLGQTPPTQEELEAREKAWQHQARVGDGLTPETVVRTPLEDLIKTFREIAAPEVTPPPLPVQLAPKPRVVPMVSVPKPAPASVPGKVPSAPAAFVQQRARHPLAVKLAAIGGLRQAVVLREILGPPKALQTADDHLI